MLISYWPVPSRFRLTWISVSFVLRDLDTRSWIHHLRLQCSIESAAGIDRFPPACRSVTLKHRSSIGYALTSRTSTPCAYSASNKSRARHRVFESERNWLRGIEDFHCRRVSGALRARARVPQSASEWLPSCRSGRSMHQFCCRQREDIHVVRKLRLVDLLARFPDAPSCSRIEGPPSTSLLKTFAAQPDSDGRQQRQRRLPAEFVISLVEQHQPLAFFRMRFKRVAGQAAFPSDCSGSK